MLISDSGYRQDAAKRQIYSQAQISSNYGNRELTGYFSTTDRLHGGWLGRSHGP